MPLAYTLFYYAVFILLVILSVKVHVIFGVFFLLYVIWLIRHLKSFHFLLAIVLVLLSLRGRPMISLPSTITGRVVVIGTSYILLSTKQGKVKVYTDEDYRFGDVLTLSYQTLPIKQAGNTHGFDERRYFQANGIVGKVREVTLLKRVHHASLADIIMTRLSQDERVASYQKLFALGIRDEMIRDDYTMMSDLSIVHLFALSGMHVTILAGLLMSLLAFFLDRQKARFVTDALIGLYVYAIPFSYSLERAFFMMILQDLFHDHYNQLDYLSGVFLFNIIKNPDVIFSTSFVFSYTVYFFVLMSASLHFQWIFIYLGSLPLILCTNYQIQLFSWLIICLLESYVTYFYILAIVSLICPPFMPLMQYAVIMFQRILMMTSALFKPIVFSIPPLSFIILYYGCFIGMLLAIEHQRPIKRYACFLIALLISFHIYSTHKLYSDVTMINVGQGDCTLVRLAMNRYNMLIDTGGSERYDIATSTLIPYLKSCGVDHLDAVYISHYDFDHSGALESLCAHFPVKKIIDTPQETQQIGPMTLDCLVTDAYAQNKNDRSNVLYLTLHGVHYLFTGDISAKVENSLKQRYGTLDVDILKVAHHGSATSSSVTLFEMIHPEIAMIGVGEKNMYGHPSPIVLDRLKSRGIKVLRTDLDRDFTIRHYGKAYYVFR